jgi:hypothetical protein
MAAKKKTAKKTGRPTDYSKDALQTALGYITKYKSEYDHEIPSVAGLAMVLEVSKKTLYNWADREENIAFLHALERLATSQELKLLNGGLSGTYNSTITKLILHNHGYSDKQETIIDDESPPTEIHFHVKEAVADIKTTNAKS